MNLSDLIPSDRQIANSLLGLSSQIRQYGKGVQGRLSDLIRDPAGTIYNAVQQQQSPFEKGVYWDRYKLDGMSGSTDTRNSIEQAQRQSAMNMVGPSSIAKTVYAPNSVNPKKLISVIDEMKQLGAPTIRAYYDGEAYHALEGSHRIAAAKKLGITPDIVEMEPKQWLTNHDLYDLPDKTSVARALKLLSENREAAYSFEDLK